MCTCSGAKEVSSNTTNRRNQQSRKKSAINRRRSHPAPKRTVPHIIPAEEPHATPSPWETQRDSTSSRIKAHTPEDKSPVSILGAFDSSPDVWPSISQTISSKIGPVSSVNRTVSESIDCRLRYLCTVCLFLVCFILCQFCNNSTSVVIVLI